MAATAPWSGTGTRGRIGKQTRRTGGRPERGTTPRTRERVPTPPLPRSGPSPGILAGTGRRSSRGLNAWGTRAGGRKSGRAPLRAPLRTPPQRLLSFSLRLSCLSPRVITERSWSKGDPKITAPILSREISKALLVQAKAIDRAAGGLMDFSESNGAYGKGEDRGGGEERPRRYSTGAASFVSTKSHHANLKAMAIISYERAYILDT